MLLFYYLTLISFNFGGKEFYVVIPSLFYKCYVYRLLPEHMSYKIFESVEFSFS